MKCNYKKNLIHKLLLSYETKIKFKLTLLDALNDIKLAWDDVKQEIVSNCFNHCWEIKLVNPENDVGEVENFEYLFNRLKNYCPIPNEVCYEDFINADNGLVRSCTLSSNFEEEYCKSLKLNMNTEIIDVEDNGYKVEHKIPSFNEAFDAVNQIHLYIQAHKYLEKLKDDWLNWKISELKQTKLSDYFRH